MKQSAKTTKSMHLAAVLTLSIALALPATVQAGDKFSTVNKAIRIDENSLVGDVESVNGSIRIGSSSVVESVQAVNGAIDIKQDVKVEKGVKAVNGAIELSAGSEVGGAVETVNGSIELHDTAVADNVETINGGIRLLSGTVIEGNVIVRKPSGWSSDRRKPVEVEIGENVVVNGDLLFEQPVKLKIHDSARVGEVIGEEVEVVGAD